MGFDPESRAWFQRLPSTLCCMISSANDCVYRLTVNASEEPFSVWFLRWWRTGARFDPVLW